MYYCGVELVTHMFGDFISVVTFSDLSWYYPVWLYARVFLFMILAAPFGEILFNPLHRLQHASSSYSVSHKYHHNFTNELCGLVFFSGTAIDDFMMAASLVWSLFLHVGFFYSLGLLNGYMCTSLFYIIWGLSTYAHSHNSDLATLVLPIPDDKNFVSYHRQHHLDPSCNMGLCEQGDIFWDWVLGQQTIKKTTKKK